MPVVLVAVTLVWVMLSHAGLLFSVQGLPFGLRSPIEDNLVPLPVRVARML